LESDYKIIDGGNTGAFIEEFMILADGTIVAVAPFAELLD
jgi:hypothetical protein